MLPHLLPFPPVQFAAAPPMPHLLSPNLLPTFSSYHFTAFVIKLVDSMFKRKPGSNSSSPPLCPPLWSMPLLLVSLGHLHLSLAPTVPCWDPCVYPMLPPHSGSLTLKNVSDTLYPALSECVMNQFRADVKTRAGIPDVLIIDFSPADLGGISLLVRTRTFPRLLSAPSLQHVSVCSLGPTP